tara:strand:+ start:241 stop:483 length:243 start_codon:yes stop_codon:yes gene_type:complete
MKIPKFKLFEDNADYNPSEHAKQLQERAKMNKTRYKAAQERGDNYGIALYTLKMKLDDYDMEKMKVRTAIQKLKMQYKKI